MFSNNSSPQKQNSKLQQPIQYQMQPNFPSTDLQNQNIIRKTNNYNDNLFDSIFDTLKQNLFNDSKEHRITQQEFMYDSQNGKNQMKQMKEQVNIKYLNKIEQVKNKYKKQFKENEQLMENIKAKVEKIENNLDVLEQKFETETKLQMKLIQNQLMNQGAFQITKNWIFSLLLDMEKCSRFAQRKQYQQLEYVQKQKQKFQEFKLLKTIENLVQTQNLPLVKFSQYQKLKHPNDQLKQIISNNITSEQIENFELVGVIRSKPYIKQTNIKSNYRISIERNSMIDVCSLLQSHENLNQAKEKLFHIENSKLNLESQLDENDTTLVTLNQFIRAIQNPQYSSKDLRIFVCSKQLQQSQIKNSNFQQLSNLHKKMQDDSLQLRDIIKLQEQDNNCYEFSKQKEAQIKRIKGTNQLKIQHNENQFALLDECQVKYLLKSKVYQKYFSDSNMRQKQDEKLQNDSEDEEYQFDFEEDQVIQEQDIDDFYIIEENSTFTVNENSNFVISKERKVSRIRKLNDIEISSLILAYTKVKQLTQNIEIKFQQDLLRKMLEKSKMDFDKNQDNLSQNDNQNSTLNNNYKYFLIDKVDANSNYLLKQYLIRGKIPNFCNDPHLLSYNQKIQKQIMQCNWPTCLQMVDYETYLNFQIMKNNQLQQSVIQSNTSRKRPSSGTKQQQKEQQHIVKLTRSNFLMDLDIQDSAYLRFFKKIKLNKDKSSRTLAQQQIQSNSTNTSIQQYGQTPIINSLITNNNQQQTLNSNVQQILQTLTSQSTTNSSQNQSSYTMEMRQSIQRKEFSSKTLIGNITQQINTNSQLDLCLYHRDIETYLTYRYGLQLQPQSVICNSFVKALRNYDNWKEEIKNSLCFDLLVDTGKGNYMIELIHKMFNFCINQSKGMSGNPNIYNLLEILQQQPQQINNIDNFFQWIETYIQHLKQQYIKNNHFQEASNHFINQLQIFQSNLQQAKENEIYIVTQVKQWTEQISQLPIPFFKENFGQILEIIRMKDILQKFQQFKFIFDRVNQMKNQQQRYPQNQFMSQMPSQNNADNKSLFNQQKSILPIINENPSMTQTGTNFYSKQVQNMANIQVQNINRGFNFSANGENSCKSSNANNNTFSTQSSIVEKLTSIYGGPNIKKNSGFQDQATTQVRQLIEQKILSNDTNKPQQQAHNSNSLVSRKQSAGSKKDLNMLLPQNQEFNNNKNQLPQSTSKIPNFILQQQQPLQSEYNLNNSNTSIIQNSSIMNKNNSQAIRHIGYPVNGFLNNQQNNLNQGIQKQETNFNPDISIQSNTTNKHNAIKGNSSNYQSSPLSRSLYKVPFSNNSDISTNNGIKVTHKQRASSAYKQRQDNLLQQVPQSQTFFQNSNTLIRPSSSTSQQILLPQQQQNMYYQQIPIQNQNNPVFLNAMPNQQQPLLFNLQQHPLQIQQQQQPFIIDINSGQTTLDPIASQYNFIQQYGIPIVQNQSNIQVISNNSSQQENQNTNAIKNIKRNEIIQTQAPKLQINNQFTPQQMQLQQIYNTKLTKPTMMGQIMSQGLNNNTNNQPSLQQNIQQSVMQQQLQHSHTSVSKQRQQERQNAIVMTYSNAVPRIGSANPGEKERKKMGGTFYNEKSGVPTGKKSKKSNKDKSDKKQIIMNNFVKNN